MPLCVLSDGQTNEAAGLSTFRSFEQETKALVQKKLAEEVNKLTGERNKLQKQLIDVKCQNQRLIEENEKLRRKKKQESVKRKNQDLKRKEDQVNRWKNKYFMLKQQRTVKDKRVENQDDKQEHIRKLDQRLRNIKYRNKMKKAQTNELKQINQALEISGYQYVTDLEVRVEMQTKRIDELENELMKLRTNDILCLKPRDIETKEINIYTDPVRKSIFHMLSSQVPVEKVGSVLQFTIQEITGHTLKDVPSVSTVCRMAREMGVVSDLHAATIACTTSSPITVGWDSTPVDGTHVNETHICTKDGGELTVSLAELPGGKTDDYVECIVNSFKDVITSYSEYVGLSKEEVTASLYRNVSSTIGDRVAVNHCVVQKLSQVFGKELIELNCNLHPLDGLAGSARKTLKNTGIQGAVFGKEAAAINFIKAMCKMRFKANCGDPGGFKVFMKRMGMPISSISRYVGNRLHVMFELSGVFCVHSGSFKKYLEKFCPVTNGLRGALIKDNNNAVILDHLRILGLYGKKLTGPWMSKLYISGGQHHLSVLEPLRQCIQSLEAVANNGNKLENMEVDMFGDQLKKDEVLTGDNK